MNATQPHGLPACRPRPSAQRLLGSAVSCCVHNHGRESRSDIRREFLPLFKLLVHRQRQGLKEALDGDGGGLEGDTGTWASPALGGAAGGTPCTGRGGRTTPRRCSWRAPLRGPGRLQREHSCVRRWQATLSLQRHRGSSPSPAQEPITQAWREVRCPTVLRATPREAMPRRTERRWGERSTRRQGRLGTHLDVQRMRQKREFSQDTATEALTLPVNRTTFGDSFKTVSLI